MNKRKFNSWSFGNTMSVRFLPDDDDDAAAQAIKEAEEAELKKQEEFDKTRQRADQEAANAQKARQQAEQATQQLAEIQAKSEAMQKELDELRSKAGGQGIDLNEEDFDDVAEVKLVKAIKVLEAKLEATNKAKDDRFAKLEKIKDDLLAERKAEQEKRSRDAVYEQLLSDLDSEYGSQFRNIAVKQFDKLVAEGKAGNNPAQCTRTLEKCYKEAKKAADKEGTQTLSLDPGAGGGSPKLGRAKLKPGSLAEVSAQLQAARTG